MHKKQYLKWIKEIFELSEEIKIDIGETQDQHKDHIHYQTTITIQNQGDNPDSYIIKKPLQEIEKKDIQLLKRRANVEKGKLHPIFGPVFRFIAWWFAFTGLYSMFAVCPFCGNAGCVVGVGSAGIVGGFLALMLQYGKTAVSFIKNGMLKILSAQ